MDWRERARSRRRRWSPSPSCSYPCLERRALRRRRLRRRHPRSRCCSRARAHDRRATLPGRFRPDPRQSSHRSLRRSGSVRGPGRWALAGSRLSCRDCAAWVASLFGVRVWAERHRAAASDWAVGVSATPLVSVIIPTRNRPALVARAGSAVGQSYANQEIVVVDDGSATPRPPAEFAADPRVRVVWLGTHRGSAKRETRACGRHAARSRLPRRR